MKLRGRLSAMARRHRRTPAGVHRLSDSGFFALVFVAGVLILAVFAFRVRLFD